MSGAMTVEMILRLVDQATAPLRGVTNEVEKLERAAKDLGGGQSRVKASVWFEQQQGIRKARSEAEDYENQLKSLDNTFSSLAASAAGFFAAHAGAKLFREEAAAGEEGLKNLLSMKTGGYSDEEIGGAQKKARETSSKYPQFSRSQIEDQIVETTQALGSIEHAEGLTNSLTRFRAVVEAQDPRAASGEGMKDIVRALEDFGVAGDATKVEAYLGEMAKVENSYKKLVTPGDWQQFAVMAQTLAAKQLSLDYLGGAGASLIAAEHGSRAGTKQRMFYQAIPGGHVGAKAASEFVNVGLARPWDVSQEDPDVRLNSKGHVIGLKAGHIKGSDLAKTNPYRWVTEVLLPALRAKGMDDDKINNWVSENIVNSSAREMIQYFIANQRRIEKETRLKNKAQGLEAAETWKADGSVAFRSVGNQTENIFRNAAEPVMGLGVSALTKTALGMNSWENNVAKDRPWVDTGLSGAAMAGAAAITAFGASKAFKWWKGSPAATGLAPPNGVPALDLSAPNVRAMANFEQAVKALAENGGKPEGLTGAAAETFAKAHPAAQARMMEAAQAAVKTAPGTASLLGKIGSGLGKGLIYGLASLAGEWAIDKMFDPSVVAKGEKNIHAGADQFYKDMGWGRPHWPSFTGEAKAGPLDVKVQPKADTTQIDDAKQKADEAGTALKALDTSVAPKVDLTHIRALNVEIIKALHGLQKLGALAGSIPGQAGHSIRRGYSPGTHALHDGSELY